LQRTSAALLVSSKRNFSVGDSTWPVQKSTLAWPRNENSPAIHGWVGRSGRTRVPSGTVEKFFRFLQDLEGLQNLNPRLKPWAIFKNRQVDLRRQFFAVRQMVAIPTHQSRVAGVFKQEFQRRRFDVAGAKDHVGFARIR